MDKNKKNILLGLKKRGFGKGKINGFGGKIEPTDLSTEDGAKRELFEESGLISKKMNFRDLLTFLYVVDSYDKIPIETDEMKPEWYNVNNIPYDKMWSDDKYWLQDIINGHTIFGHFHFHENLIDILDYNLDIQ